MFDALITDLDGTAISLSSNGENVDVETVRSIQEAYSNGKHVICATGRRWELAASAVRSLGLKGACIFEGGACIVDVKTEKVLWERPLSLETVRSIVDVFRRYGAGDEVLHMQGRSDHPIGETEDVKLQGSRYVYLLACISDAAASIANDLNAQGFVAAHLTPSWFGKGLVDIHVTDVEGTKGHAVSAWSEMNGVPKERIIAMGDSGNDIPLFEGVGLKVAVGNATEALRSLADYIAPTQSEDAVSHVIRTVLLRKI